MHDDEDEYDYYDDGWYHMLQKFLWLVRYLCCTSFNTSCAREESDEDKEKAVIVFVCERLVHNMYMHNIEYEIM